MNSDGDWSHTTLGTACEVNPSKPKFTELPDATPVMFVPMASVDEVRGEITAPRQVRLGDMRKKSFTTFAPGDVLFAKITPCMENGKAAIVPDIPSGIGFGSTEFHVLRPASGVNPRFIWHLLRQESFRGQAETHMTGSVGQARVPAAFLRDCPISLPPERIQTQIVQTLDTASELRRSASKHLGSARSSIDRFRQSILAAACSGRLTAEWRDARDVLSNEHISELLQLRRANWPGSRVSSSKARYREPLPPFAWDDQLPPTWCVTSLSQVAYLDVGHAFASGDYSAQGIPLLRGENSAPGRLKWNDVKYWPQNKLGPFQHLLMEPDDLVLGMDRPIISSGLKLSRVTATDTPSLLVQRVLRIRAVDRANAGFIEFCLLDGRFQSYLQSGGMTGSDLPHITGTGVAQFPIPLPPTEERAEIVHRVNELFGLADSISSRIDFASTATEECGRAVLAMAMGGGATAPAQR